MKLLVLIFILSGCFARQIPTIDQGVVLLREGRISEAKAVFIDNLSEDNSSLVYDGLGCVAFYEGDYKTSQASFLKALEINPKNLSAKENLAFLYDEIGDTAKTRNLYIELEREGSFRALNNYAENLYNQGEKRRAEQILNLAYKISNNKTVWRNINHEKGN